jgi:hypothetical protein
MGWRLGPFICLRGDVAIPEPNTDVFPSRDDQPPPRHPAMPMRADLTLPGEAPLLAALADLAARADPIARYMAAFRTGHFIHPDGRADSLGHETILPAQAAMIAHLCRHCPTPLSIETGFGSGTSAMSCACNGIGTHGRTSEKIPPIARCAVLDRRPSA